MAKYNLKPNESVILKNDKVLYGSLMANFTDELILTNLNLVLVKKGLLGNAKSIHVFPLNQIKVFDGQAQMLLGKSRYGHPLMEVYLLNGHEKFGFNSKKETVKWISKINKIITGNEAEIDTMPGLAIPGAEYFAETIKGTVDIFKGVMGISLKNSSEVTTQVAKKCTSCGAPLSGIKGQITSCHYCDSEYHL